MITILFFVSSSCVCSGNEVFFFLFQCHVIYESAQYDSSSFYPVKQDHLEKILQKLPVAFR